MQLLDEGSPHRLEIVRRMRWRLFAYLLKNVMNLKINDSPVINPKAAQFVSILEHHVDSQRLASASDNEPAPVPCLVELQKEKNASFHAMVHIWLDVVAKLSARMPSAEDAKLLQAAEKHKIFKIEYK